MLLFSDSSCAVFKVRLKFSFLFRDPKLQNDTETIFEAQSNFISDFRRLLLPVFLRLCFLLEAFFIFRSAFFRSLSYRPWKYEVVFQTSFLPRKEVIQPHLPIRLPCYDFTPVIGLTLDGCLLAVSSPASGAPNSHGVTGGVYKARERIHRDILIRDY